MKKYQQLARLMAEQIESGIWSAGDRLPSLREQAKSSGLSLMTVSHAYQLLESQGRILARPQSGYYVAPRPLLAGQTPVEPVTRRENVDINTYIFDVLQSSRDADIVPFGSAFPDPGLFPLQLLNRSLARVSKTPAAISLSDNLPPGNAGLRHAIAQRYAQQGVKVSPDEIVITAGALEALNLSLQVVTQPGDWVIVENPCFYGALQALERLGLKALAIESDPREGINLLALSQALEQHRVKACWLMANSQNPMGFTLSASKKQALVKLLAAHQVVLIEDDVYRELYYGRDNPLPLRAYDEQGITLHCASYSKCLVAGFRIGWVAAGRYARRIQQLQLMSTLSTSSPMQLALVDFLATRRFDTHLRRLRKTLAERKRQVLNAISEHFPAGTRVFHEESGYFLWIALPASVDTRQLYLQALEHKISIAPGNMFSTDSRWDHCFRLNTSWPWGEREQQAIITLSRLISQRI